MKKKIFDSKTGQILELSAGIVDARLRHDHVDNGGRYSEVKEAPNTEPAPEPINDTKVLDDAPAEPIKRRRRRKKQENN